VDNEGKRHAVSSADVNDYLREISSQTDGPSFTAKDFRTWAGTVLAFAALRAAEECPTDRASRKCVTRCIREVAERLGNTPTVCRSSYVAPEVLEAFLDPNRRLELAHAAEKVQSAADATSRYPEEPALLEFLRTRQPK
jgi:DNA topoisomerase-1